MTFTERAPAKLNLSLRVLGRLPDGNHEVETVLQAIDVCDRLEIEPGPITSLIASGFEVPAGPDNLVLRAAAAAGLTGHFRLEKLIPPGAGLGGGSSDAAAVLRTRADSGLDLPEVAARLGADVPFFLRGGRALATGRGEKLRWLPVEAAWYAIAWPGFGVSTAAVYGAWDEVGGDGPNELFRAACSVEPRLAGFADDLGRGWRMTGSGSAFFREAATEAEARAAVAGRTGWTAVARSLDGLA